MKVKLFSVLMVFSICTILLQAQTPEAFKIPEGAFLEDYIPGEKYTTTQYSILETGLISSKWATYLKTGNSTYGPFYDIANTINYSLDIIPGNIDPPACKVRINDSWFIYSKAEKYGPFMYQPVFFYKNKERSQIVCIHEDAGGYQIIENGIETFCLDYYYFKEKLYFTEYDDTGINNTLLSLGNKTIGPYNAMRILNMYELNGTLRYETSHYKGDYDYCYLENNDETIGPFNAIAYDRPDNNEVLFSHTNISATYEDFYQGEYNIYVVYSKDRTKRLYILNDRKNYSIIPDTNKLGVFEKIKDVSYSPDGKIVSFIYTANNKDYLQCNNETSEPFDEICSYKYSPDSTKIAYEVRVDGKYYLYNGTKKIDTFNYSDYELRNGRHFFYSFLKDGTFVYQNNKNPTGYELILHVGSIVSGPYEQMENFKVSSDQSKVYCFVLKDYKDLSTDMLENGKPLKVKISPYLFNLK